VFGFFRTILALFESYNPAHLAVVMDSRVPTFRHEMYPAYKANREKAPEDLHEQVPRIEAILDAMGIPWLMMDGYEADDIMATYARLCSAEGRSCFIVSGDKDLLQLVNDQVRVLKSDKGSYAETDREGVFAEWGVFPEQIVDYLSLTGDQSDNVPGAKGIGPKTAAKLLQDFKTLDGIYGSLDSLPEGQRKKLAEDRENVFLSKRLIVLKDVPNPLPLDTFATEGVRLSAAVPLFLKEGMNKLADQVRGERDSLFAASDMKPEKKAAPPLKSQDQFLFPR
jgi:DNA polymerase-1